MSELIETAQRILEWARDDEQVEVVLLRQRETDIRAYDGEVEAFTAAESLGVGIRVIRDSRQGFSYAGTLDPAELGEVLAEARDNAEFATPDEYLGLARPDGVAFAALDLYDEALDRVGAAEKIAMALELERAARSADPRICGIDSADYGDAAAESVVANTLGVLAHSRETSAYVSVGSVAADGEERQEGYGFSVGRAPGTLDLTRAVTDATDRATRLLGATPPRSGRLTVVFDPYVTAQFLSIVGETLNGDAVMKGRSLFADRVGDHVASPLVTLVDDPTDGRAFTASISDGEGLATRRVSLISAGRLDGFVHDTYSARRLSAASTGSAVRGGFRTTPSAGIQALTLVPGARVQTELIASIDDGLLVQEVSGLHSGVNPISGDFSTGVAGLRIRSGQLAEPIREATIASTLQRMLLDVIEVGGDIEWLPMAAAGVSLVIADVTLSGR